MATVPIPIAGPTYENRSLPVSNQRTQNFYVQVNKQGNELATLQPFAGLKLLGKAGSSGGNRGSGMHKGVYYTVTGNKLYSMNASGAPTEIGVIGGGGRCVLESDGIHLVITTGETRPYTYDGTDLKVGGGANLTNSKTSTYMNRRVIYDGAGNDIIFPDLDSPLTVNSANIASEDSNPDDVIAVKQFNQQLYVFGETSIAPWYNVGTGNPPYSPITNASKTDLGLAAPYSVSENKQYLYFLGSDLQPYRLSGLQVQPLGNPAIGKSIANYPTASDAFGFCFSIDNQEFYYLVFPSGNESWLYHEQSNFWTSLVYGSDNGRHLMNSYCYCYGKHLVADYRNGNIYELDTDTYDDNGDTIHRVREGITISAKALGSPGKDLMMQRLELIIEPGVSLLSGQATIIIEWSDDDGRTWSSENWELIGDKGDYQHKIELFGLGKFRRRQFRFEMTDPVKWVLISANADVEVCI